MFSAKLSGDALKRAFIHSLLFRQLLTDYQMLATAGGDFAKKNEDGGVDPNTSIVPDKYDPLYAYCGVTDGATTPWSWTSADVPLFAGLTPSQPDEEKLVTRAVECVLARIPTGINRGVEGDEGRPPAMASRNALYQMLARFEKFDVDTAALSGDKRMAEDDTIEEQEKLLKQLKAQAEAQKKGGGGGGGEEQGVLL